MVSHGVSLEEIPLHIQAKPPADASQALFAASPPLELRKRNSYFAKKGGSRRRGMRVRPSQPKPNWLSNRNHHEARENDYLFNAATSLLPNQRHSGTQTFSTNIVVSMHMICAAPPANCDGASVGASSNKQRNRNACRAITICYHRRSRLGRCSEAETI